MDLGVLLRVLVTGWSFEPSVILGIVFAALLYWRGWRYSMQRGIGRHLRGWRAFLFACGLGVIFVALESPIDHWSDYYFWVHMLQHELLLLVAAPLLLLGEPAWPIWRALPPGWRRAMLSWALRQQWFHQLAHFVDKRLFAPVTAWALYAGVFTLWHLPAAYDLALQHQLIHDAEHLLFLGTALLFWVQVIPSRPLKPRLSYMSQALFLFAAAVEGGLVNLVFMFSPNPVYPYYVTLARIGRPAPFGMLFALTDQKAGGGVMDVAAGLVFMIAIMVVLGLWLAADEKADTDQLAPAHAAPAAELVTPESSEVSEVSARSA